MKRILLAGLALGTLAAAASLRAEAPRPNPAAPVAAGSNQFALELYGKLRGQDGNLFFSPFSVSTALAMTSTGAKGRTLEQMVGTLHMPADPVQAHAGYAALLKGLNAEGIDPKKRGYDLSVANALWGQQGIDWKPDFLAAAEKYYGAGLREVDFKGATEAAGKTINAWVEQQTHNKIKDLIKSGVLQPDTRLVLTNAIYFKGAWAIEFDKKRTRDEAFHLSADRQVKAPMMHQESGFFYGETDSLQMLQLPYRGNEVSMVVLLPKKRDGLEAMEKSLSAENLSKWLRQLRHEEKVIVTLPKFKMTREFDLERKLSELGMKDLFAPGLADLSGMTGAKNLFVSNVIHKAFVEVNEEGTEAAAATAVIVRPTSAPLNPRPVPVFKADHPFIFVIRDNRSGAVLFMGRLADPSK